MVFHALSFAKSQGSCLKLRPLGQVFKLFLRDMVNVIALKQPSMIVILAFYMIYDSYEKSL